MRLRIMTGVLILLLGITAYTLYRDSHVVAETPPDHVYEPPMQTVSEEGWTRPSEQWTMILAIIRLDLDDALLADMDAREPRLVLEATDGSRAYVTGWRVSKGERPVGLPKPRCSALYRPASYLAGRGYPAIHR